MASQFLGKDQQVDMSDLISFSMGFSKLGLVLGDVVSRLGDLEKKVNDPDAGPTGAAAAAPAIREDSRPDHVNRAVPTTGAARPDEAAATESAATGSKPRAGSTDPTNASNNAADGSSGAAPNGMVAVPASDLAALTKRVKALEDEVDALRNAGDRGLPRADDGAGDAVEADAAKQAPAGNAKDAETRAKAAEARAKDADARAKAAERAAQDALELAKSAGEKADAVSDRLSKQLRQQGPAAVDGQTAATAANAGAPSVNSAAMDDLADQLAQLSKAVDKVANQQRGQAGDIAALNEAVHHPSGSNSGAAAAGAPSATSAPADVVARIAALEDAVKRATGPDAPTTSTASNSGPTKGDHTKKDDEHQATKAATPNDSTLRDAIRAMEDRVAKLESAAPSNDPAGVGAPGGVGAGAGAGSVGDKSGGDKSGDRASGKLPAGDQQLKDLAAQVAELQKRLNGQVPAATEVAGVHTVDPVDKSFAPPSAALELERLHSQMKQLAGDVDALKQRNSTGGVVAPAATEGSSPAGDFGDLPSRVDALQRALDDLNARVAGFPAPSAAAPGPHVGGEPSTEVANEAARAAHDARAASEAADQALKRLGEMNDGQDALRKKIQQIEAALAALPAAGAGGDVSGTQGALAPVSVEDAVKKVLADRDQAALKAGLAPPNGATTAPDGTTTAPTEMQQSLAHQVLDIRATVDHLIHGKADAAQVANKAERDYVEGALEKLMQEVERVINITNASLIDTLDKSLGLLRDMIDGKATKADLAKARLLGAQGAAGNSGLSDTQQVPDGLIGFKSYRCLGCNRTVEAMRVRPMGSSAQAFSAKLPPSATTRQPKPPALSASLPALTAPLPPMPPSSA